MPLTRTQSEVFDDLVLDAGEALEHHWAAELGRVEFAVEDVPPVTGADGVESGPDVILDRGIPLGQLFRGGIGSVTQPVIVVYRRPIEARAVERDDRADLVFMIVAELVAELLGRDIDEIDPPRS